MPPPPSYGGGSRRGKAPIAVSPVSDHGAGEIASAARPLLYPPPKTGEEKKETKIKITGKGKHMSGQFRPSRRAMLKVGLAATATITSPAILRLTAKAQEMVERHNCRLFTGITLSSEALAVVPKLAEWDSIFISGINGDGRLTAESFVPNFFRANISGPMGTRAVSLYLKTAKLDKFYALGLDYAWGHNSVAVFENEVKKSKKEFLGKVFAPTGTKDYSTYITKIRQSGADAVFMVMQGDDNNAFLSQSRQYRLPEKVKLLTEIVDLASIRAVGEASSGLIHSSRYSFTYDHPLNNEFAELWKKEHNTVPDTFEGEQWQCMKVFEAGITKAGGLAGGQLLPGPR